MFKKIWNNKLFRQISYFLFVVLAIISLWFVGKEVFNFGYLLEAYELKTFDARVNMTAKHYDARQDIVVISIDDDSIEVLQDELGRWPWSRDVYAEAIEYLEAEKVDSVAFDLMFVGHQRGFEDKDLELVKAIGKYDNVYTSMNFDFRDNKPVEIPDKLTINLENNSENIDYSMFSYSYCRLILDEIIQATDKIGFINFRRDPIDKISRRGPTFFKYQDEYYPYLALKLAADYIERHEGVEVDKFEINENNELVFGNRRLPLDETGSMIINWYGFNEEFGIHKTYRNIPFWKVYKSALNVKNGKEPLIPADYFKDKLVYVGATAVSLYDAKSTPLSSVYPGVEVQATILNNILDNKVVKRVDQHVDFIISILLSFLVAILVIKVREPMISSIICIAIALLYIFSANYMLEHYCLWIGIIYQMAFMIATFTIMFVIKYVLKAKDFEYTYKLATTDGLTGLYNHRYFQESLKDCMRKSDKDGSSFSLILIDIDFFKKFNDTYGHQAGDEVLRQVAYMLKKYVNPADLVARYGGEEMVILLPDVGLDKASMVANRLCRTIADKKFELAEGITVQVTISLGVATYPQHGKTSTELIEFSDKGLYNAKEEGRNQLGRLPEISEIK